jgi:hypothetical protein
MAEASGKKRLNKKRFFFTVLVLALIVGGGGGVALWQRGNLDAAKLYLNNSPEDIHTQLAENEQQIAASMQKLLPNPVMDLTDEEKRQLANNELSQDEAVQLILARAKSSGTAQTAPVDTTQTNADGQETPNADTTAQPGASQGAAASESTSENDTTSQADASDEKGQAKPVDDTAQTQPKSGNGTEPDPSDEYVAEAVAQVYVLRAQFTGKLDSLMASAKAEYDALSPENRTASKQAEIGMKYLKIGGQLESECDAQMNSIVSNLDTELRQTGGDRSIVAEIKAEYAKEKSLQKAYYLSLYQNK